MAAASNDEGGSMGTFDDLKARATQMANDLAAGAQKSGKLAQAQLKLSSLQKDAQAARTSLGGLTYGLASRGEISHPELAEALEKVRAADELVRAKEQEIAQVKSEGGDGAATGSDQA
jgi:hypothetical protein